VDYIDIRLADAIETLTLQQLLYACYDSTSYPNNPSCSSFSRNAAGQITTFHAGYVNAGLLHFQGIQAGIDYTFDLPANVGKIETRASYLEERQLVSQIGSASPIQYAGQLGAPTSKGTVDATYLKGPVSWNVQAIFVGSANFNNLNTETSQNILTIHPWWLINSTVGYEVTKAVTARLIVDNVFNKQPPFPSIAGTGGNFADATTQYFSGIIGRTYLLSANVRF
jgi:outer membrane receptor protein involved in Fe transport